MANKNRAARRRAAAGRIGAGRTKTEFNLKLGVSAFALFVMVAGSVVLLLNRFDPTVFLIWGILLFVAVLAGLIYVVQNNRN